MNFRDLNEMRSMSDAEFAKFAKSVQKEESRRAAIIEGRIGRRQIDRKREICEPLKAYITRNVPVYHSRYSSNGWYINVVGQAAQKVEMLLKPIPWVFVGDYKDGLHVNVYADVLKNPSSAIKRRCKDLSPQDIVKFRQAGLLSYDWAKMNKPIAPVV